MEEIKLMPEIIKVEINSDGYSATEIRHNKQGRKFKIQEIMLGAAHHRKSIPYPKSFLLAFAECKAEVLENGKLRII